MSSDCWVPAGCRSYKRRESCQSETFHRFPVKAKIRHEWIVKIKSFLYKFSHEILFGLLSLLIFTIHRDGFYNWLENVGMSHCDRTSSSCRNYTQGRGGKMTSWQVKWCLRCRRDAEKRLCCARPAEPRFGSKMAARVANCNILASAVATCAASDSSLVYVGGSVSGVCQNTHFYLTAHLS